MPKKSYIEKYRSQLAFTLIEVSIVMVIIGLVVGAVVVGRDMITTAAIRATITQIQGYNAAVRQFEEKYRYLPGDISASAVQKFGFSVVPVRAGTIGQGNGNGLIENYLYVAARSYVSCCISGENAWFWEDLSANSGLIEDNFNTAGAFSIPFTSERTTIKIEHIIPRSKLKKGVYVSVYSTPQAKNYLSLLAFGTAGALDGNGAIRNNSVMLTVNEAYSIDAKMDDGLPQSGLVIAKYQQWDIASAAVGGSGPAGNYGLVWASGGNVQGAIDTSATPSSSITCFDNNNVAAAVQKYSIAKNPNSANCALSFELNLQ